MTLCKLKKKHMIGFVLVMLGLSLVTEMFLVKKPGNYYVKKYTSDTTNTNKTMKELWVFGSGNLIERLSLFNKALADERRRILATRESKSWLPVNSQIMRISGKDPENYYSKITAQPITTIFLSWIHSKISEMVTSGDETHQLIVNRYYEWTATEPFCKWITTPKQTKYKPSTVDNRTCTTNVTRTVVLDIKRYWDDDGVIYQSSPDVPNAIFYIHIIEDCIVTNIGDIVSKSFMLMPKTCRRGSPGIPKSYATTPIHDEVFVISQFWGAGIFHMFLEDLPRLAPYTNFLKKHQNIKIHVGGSKASTILNYLGIDSSRVISGLVRSKVVYLPQPTSCGHTHVQEAQLLSQLFRIVIETKKNNLPRNSIVLIQRSGRRRFKESREIKQRIQRISEQNGFRFELFPDNPVPQFTEAVQMFNRAVLIVGPHGAGLSNMLFAEPGTYIVEGICNPPHVNMCYQWSAHVLGHHYHAIPSRRGCENVVDIDPALIEDTVMRHLKIISAS